MCVEEDSGTHDLWIVGVFLGFAAAVFSNFGVNIQKYSFMQEAKRPISKARPYLKQPLWVLGIIGVMLGSLGDFVALGFAPTTLVIPIGGFTLVANLFFAHLWLKESLGPRDMGATFLIVIGVILVALFAEKGSSCHTLDQLIDYYSEPGFIVYMVFMVLSLVGCHSLTNHIEKIYSMKGPGCAEYQRWKLIHPVSYPAMSGIFGGQSVLFAKSVAELVKSTINDKNEFTKPWTYVIILVMCFCIFAQIHVLTKGLQWFDAIFVVPVFQCFFITTSVVGGIVYFKEIEELGPGEIVGFMSGLVILLVGVYGLALRKMNKLAPIARFRVSVHMVRAMRRLQRARGIEWDYEASSKAPPTIVASAQGPNKIKISNNSSSSSVSDTSDNTSDSSSGSDSPLVADCTPVYSKQNEKKGAKYSVEQVSGSDSIAGNKRRLSSKVVPFDGIDTPDPVSLEEFPIGQ